MLQRCSAGSTDMRSEAVFSLQLTRAAVARGIAGRGLATHAEARRRRRCLWRGRARPRCLSRARVAVSGLWQRRSGGSFGNGLHRLSAWSRQQEQSPLGFCICARDAGCIRRASSALTCSGAVVGMAPTRTSHGPGVGRPRSSSCLRGGLCAATTAGSARAAVVRCARRRLAAAVASRSASLLCDRGARPAVRLRYQLECFGPAAETSSAEGR